MEDILNVESNSFVTFYMIMNRVTNKPELLAHFTSFEVKRFFLIQISYGILKKNTIRWWQPYFTAENSHYFARSVKKCVKYTENRQNF